MASSNSANTLKTGRRDERRAGRYFFDKMVGGPASCSPGSISAAYTLRFVNKASAIICGRRLKRRVSAPPCLVRSRDGMTGLAVRLRCVNKIYDSGVGAGPSRTSRQARRVLLVLGPSGCGNLLRYS